MSGVLVVAERAPHAIDEATWELATAARTLAPGEPVTALLIGAGAADRAQELTPWFEEVLAVDDGRSAGDGVANARVVADIIATRAPDMTLLAHTNVGIDVAPRAAVLAGIPLVTDCLELGRDGDSLHAVRALYGGKANARVRVDAASGAMATLRPGAFRAGDAPGVSGTISVLDASPEDSRRRHVETVEPDPGAVDITQAEILVCVGRGIEEEESLEIARGLADALGAEIACTRPVVDKGWLPKTYQVGTSGVSVRPKVYIAAGVSGSFQHMGGVKGDPYIIAINEDETAPIFAVADVGIVGDLFEVLPLLEEKIRKTRG